ncbi:MAG: methylated-DNA--[protein]-cysteine S-methyltransferase [Alphaproteobacteria bacterium]|nr:methylated-DNA--[protein]-cysteine S-methyltransferase [Alphaproteobacteria bacterium]MDE2013489.1 methylated-DNA--[protein]-cysteine S-methyltransferase [Alphaproteobacteria bacterium]MDE2072647.1 methylated-DNA--[protein]-cysteine S-methyltransferase [Alphaproteobacteria bacterium]
MSEKIYWSRIDSRFGTFAAWVNAKGCLLRFHLRAKGAASVDREAVEDKAALADVQRQIVEYDEGTRKSFDVVRRPSGSEFQHRVWNALWEIPYGETTSYGALAKSIGHPGGARAVGLANGQNPIGLIVPCHRVIGADGSLTGYGGGLPLKKALLTHEAEHAGRRGDLFAQT